MSGYFRTPSDEATYGTIVSVSQISRKYCRLVVRISDHGGICVVMGDPRDKYQVNDVVTLIRLKRHENEGVYDYCLPFDPNPEIEFDITDRSVYSTNSSHDIEGEIIYRIDRARKSIHIVMYHLSNRKIINALILAKKRGVKVHVIVDANGIECWQKNNRKFLKSLFQRVGINYYEHNGHGKQHNKTIIIDVGGIFPVVLFGSCNSTSCGTVRHSLALPPEEMNHETLEVQLSGKKAADKFKNSWQPVYLQIYRDQSDSFNEPALKLAA